MKTRLTGAIVMAVLFVAGSQVGRAQAPDYKAAMAQATQKLSSLHAELAGCLPYQSAFLADQLMDFSAFRAKYEAANPGKTLGENYVPADKPADPK